MVRSLSESLTRCCYCGGKLNNLSSEIYACSACNKKTFLSPPLGCNCILTQRDEVLLTQRARNPGAGTWALPGGFAQPSETCEGTMIREAYEELNITITVDQLVGSAYCDYEYEGIARPIVVVYGLGHIVSGKITCQDDVSDYMWLPLEKVATVPLFHPYEVEMIVRAFNQQKQM